MIHKGKRVRVIKAPDEEQELIGLEGDAFSDEPFGIVGVFLDDDKFPTRFHRSELKVIEDEKHGAWFALAALGVALAVVIILSVIWLG